MARGILIRRSLFIYAILQILLAGNLMSGQIHARELEKTSAAGVKPKLDWLEGSGKDLRIRLKGKVLESNGGPAADITVKVVMKARPYCDESLESQVNGSEFEVWVPVNDSDWYRVDIEASSADGDQLACKSLMLYDLRTAAVEGLTLEMQPASRKGEVSVVYNGEPVENARVSVEPVLGIAKHGRTDKSGVVSFRLLPRQKLSRLDAWTDDFKIGGYSFSRTPRLDPKADHHVIELSACREQKLRLLDGHGSPVP